jgi:hypothetical protein
VQGVTKIIDHGPDSVRWNLVILGDGYQTGELTNYAADALAFVNTLSATTPFDTLWPAINCHRVDVSSTDSGAADPIACGGTGATPSTYFDASFCGDGQIQRLLVVNTTTALNVATAQVPQMHMTIVIVNSTIYGGSGGQVAAFSKAANAQEIAIHEMGHTAFGLADEYEYFAGCASGETGHDSYTGAEPTEPNVTANADRATIKWSSLIAAATAVPTTSNANCAQCDTQSSPVPANTVGAFEGARYFHCAMYRPQFTCRMRELGNPFCAVCQQAITGTISTFMPAAPTVTGISPTRRASDRGDNGDRYRNRIHGGYLGRFRQHWRQRSNRCDGYRIDNSQPRRHRHCRHHRYYADRYLGDKRGRPVHLRVNEVLQACIRKLVIVIRFLRFSSASALWIERAARTAVRDRSRHAGIAQRHAADRKEKVLPPVPGNANTVGQRKSSRPFRRSGVDLEHVPQKWEPVLRKRTC